jgi:hypothetical protein
MNWAPWICAAFSSGIIVLVRLGTNRILQRTLDRVPWSMSVLYILGFAGLVATFFWSMFAIAWWAGIPVLGMCGLTCLVPSVVQDALRDPKIAHYRTS